MRTRIRFRLPAGASGPPNLGETSLPDGSFELSTDDATRATHELTGWALERGFSLETFEVARPSLEDVYLELTGGEEGAE